MKSKEEGFDGVTTTTPGIFSSCVVAHTIGDDMRNSSATTTIIKPLVISPP